jgi:hypothetical protein
LCVITHCVFSVEKGIYANTLKVIKNNGLPDLVDSLPTKPDESATKAIDEMFEASIDGDPYDLDRWGDFYKPINTRLSF